MNLAFIHIPKNAGTSFKNACRDLGIQYCPHSIDPKLINKDKIIVLRNPIDRFCSAVNYAIKYWSHEPHIQSITSAGLITPNEWADAFFDPDHLHHHLISFEINNANHRIQNYILKYKYTYCPQYYWISNPKYILLFENLNIEFNFLLSKIGMYNYELPLKNTSSKINNLCNNNIQLLNKFYCIDVGIYNHIKNIPHSERLS
jgi:hypothetical protein